MKSRAKAILAVAVFFVVGAATDQRRIPDKPEVTVQCWTGGSTIFASKRVRWVSQFDRVTHIMLPDGTRQDIAGDCMVTYPPHWAGWVDNDEIGRRPGSGASEADLQSEKYEAQSTYDTEQAAHDRQCAQLWRDCP